MKTVLLAGGMGTRLAEETEIRPKPMVEIGGRPILWHIMSHYSRHGFKDFLVALGYKSEVIKRYFLDYSNFVGSVSVKLEQREVIPHDRDAEDWDVHLLETGLHTNTGGRIKRLESWLCDGTFFVTYGDGVSDVNLVDLLRFHRRMGRVATVTAVRPPARYGGILFQGDLVSHFTEKPQAGEGWINGGFLVFEPSVFDYLDGDSSSLETDVLERLAAEKQLAAFRHDQFWQCMDTLRDKRYLEQLWQNGTAPWRKSA